MPNTCVPPIVGGAAPAFVSTLICSLRAALCADRRSTCATSAARSSFFVQLPWADRPEDAEVPRPKTRFVLGNVLAEVERSVPEYCGVLLAVPRIVGDTTEAMVSTASSDAVVPISASRIFVQSVSAMHTDTTSSKPTDCRMYLTSGQSAASVCVSGTMMREQKSSSCELMNMNLPSE